MDVARLGRGFDAYLRGDFAAAQKELAPLASARLLNRDYALYFLAQSESLTGATAAALAHFQKLIALQQTKGGAVVVPYSVSTTSTRKTVTA